ncbi:hypothetical protein S7711_11339 [Stachybotrys chartarum IBT 7711]|uniref:Uncharacterized protein n=1 Tax=Stachybotrys chartarum (strain CBS 109288 / IBT 7711) TaxID=1280523 RepID=A0A084AQI9_STACB|nr:hypothetical protein S7711_11339 [Stachybotrys chartarum IBT 7711]
MPLDLASSTPSLHDEFISRASTPPPSQSRDRDRKPDWKYALRRRDSLAGQGACLPACVARTPYTGHPVSHRRVRVYHGFDDNDNDNDNNNNNNNNDNDNDNDRTPKKLGFQTPLRQNLGKAAEEEEVGTETQQACFQHWLGTGLFDLS